MNNLLLIEKLNNCLINEDRNDLYKQAYMEIMRAPVDLKKWASRSGHGKYEPKYVTEWAKYVTSSLLKLLDKNELIIAMLDRENYKIYGTPEEQASTRKLSGTDSAHMLFTTNGVSSNGSDFWTKNGVADLRKKQYDNLLKTQLGKVGTKIKKFFEKNNTYSYLIAKVCASIMYEYQIICDDNSEGFLDLLLIDTAFWQDHLDDNVGDITSYYNDFIGEILYAISEDLWFLCEPLDPSFRKGLIDWCKETHIKPILGGVDVEEVSFNVGISNGDIKYAFKMGFTRQDLKV